MCLFQIQCNSIWIIYIINNYRRKQPDLVSICHHASTWYSWKILSFVCKHTIKCKSVFVIWWQVYCRLFAAFPPFLWLIITLESDEMKCYANGSASRGEKNSVWIAGRLLFFIVVFAFEWMAAVVGARCHLTCWEIDGIQSKTASPRIAAPCFWHNFINLVGEWVC